MDILPAKFSAEFSLSQMKTILREVYPERSERAQGDRLRAIGREGPDPHFCYREVM
jgi:hypothetical protein